MPPMITFHHIETGLILVFDPAQTQIKISGARSDTPRLSIPELDVDMDITPGYVWPLLHAVENPDSVDQIKVSRNYYQAPGDGSLCRPEVGDEVTINKKARESRQKNYPPHHPYNGAPARVADVSDIKKGWVTLAFSDGEAKKTLKIYVGNVVPYGLENE